jgi:hypothetical protein
MKQQSTLFIISALLVAAPVALAGTSEPAPVKFEQAPSDDWEFTLGLYGLIAGIDGDLSAGAQDASFDFEFGDILDNLDSAFMIAGSAKKDRFKFSGDLLYLGVSGSGSPAGPLFDRAALELDTLLTTVAVTYVVWEQPSTFFEIGAGARYLGMDTNLVFSDSTLVNPTIIESGDVDIWDALGVVRFGHQFSEKWAFLFYGDIGAGDSELTWQIFATLGYYINENTVATLGWRHIGYEMESGPVEVDMGISGPQLGLFYKF